MRLLRSAHLTVFMAFNLAAFALIGCERQNDAEEPDVQVTKITPPEPNLSDAAPSKEQVETEAKADIDATVNADTQSNNAVETEVMLANDNIHPLPETQAPDDAASDIPVSQETQITDVEYQNANGQSVKVTFQTSAVGALEANVMLPSGKRVMLTAPAGQGNNPTYQNSDNSIQLVSHGGGGSIDLVQAGQVTSFDAISAEAEVVTPQ